MGTSKNKNWSVYATHVYLEQMLVECDEIHFVVFPLPYFHNTHDMLNINIKTPE